MTYAESGLFWSQCFLPSLIIRKTQAGAGKSSLGLLWFKCLSAVVTSNYDVAVRYLHRSIIIPQEFTIANR